MKILRIVSSGYEQGGIETHVALLQGAQEKKGHEIRIFSSDARPDLKHFNYYSYKTPEGWNKFIYGTFNPYAYRALKKALEEFKPDIVDIHSVGYASPAILFLLKKYPTILTVHSPEGYTKGLIIWCFPASYFKNEEHDIKNLRFVGKVRYAYHFVIGRAMYWFGLKNVDTLVTLSGYMHRTIEEEGLKNKKVTMGIILLKYDPLVLGKIPLVVGYAGRLEKIKGVDYLLGSFPEILKNFPGAKLVIAGEGAEEARLKKMARDLHCAERVTFLGHLDHEQLEKFYRDTTVVVMPSANPEAFGKVGVEAMSVGRPVVASNVGGISDWLSDGENGYLVPQKDSSAIAKAVIKLFGDPELLVRMSKKAREKAEEFEFKNHLDQMEKIYEDAIKVNSEEQ